MANAIKNLKDRLVATLTGNRLVVRAAWADKMRKLAKESRARGDDPTKNSEIVKLTPTQLEFVRQDVASPNTSVNTIGGALILDESVDVDLLRQAVDRVRMNNDGLRIRFVKEDGVLKQYATAYQPLNTPLLTFENEEDLRAYCDSIMAEPYGDLEGKDINNEIHVFQLSDHRGGLIFRENHLREDAVSVALVGAYVLDIYEQIRRGRTSYQGARTSFIDHARASEGSLGSVGVGTTDLIDSASTRSTFTLSEQRTRRIKDVCRQIGRDAGLNIRPSKLFELANALYISMMNNNVQKVTLNNLATGREPKTSDDLTIGLYMRSRPVEVFLDWKATVEANLIDMKKRAKGLLEEPSYSSESDPSDTVWISFRSNPDGADALLRTPFHLYEAPRKHSPVPLFMHIEDMNETGRYNVIHDYWDSAYKAEQIERRQADILKIVDSMVANPEMMLDDLAATLELATASPSTTPVNLSAPLEN